MTWQIDPMHTQVEFAAKHFGMMTVRGRFNDVVTSGTVDPNKPEETSIEVTIDVASLNTHNQQRDNDLRSSYFLELDKYPTITFRSTEIKPAGQDRYTMTGDLTIKGITKPVTLQMQRYGEINDSMMGHRVAYSAEGEINRKDFGMSFDMLADGRLIVSHEIKVTIETELVESAQEPAQQQPAAASPSA
jgi:polyisoprenoid-binding protein YceI